MYYLYILQSKKDNTYYIGYTADLDRRLAEHNAGKNRYTKGHLPYSVIYKEVFNSIKLVKEREKYIKKYGNIKSFLKSRFPRTP